MFKKGDIVCPLYLGVKGVMGTPIYERLTYDSRLKVDHYWLNSDKVFIGINLLDGRECICIDDYFRLVNLNINDEKLISCLLIRKLKSAT